MQPPELAAIYDVSRQRYVQNDEIDVLQVAVEVRIERRINELKTAHGITGAMRRMRPGPNLIEERARLHKRIYALQALLWEADPNDVLGVVEHVPPADRQGLSPGFERRHINATEKSPPIYLCRQRISSGSNPVAKMPLA